MNESKMTAADAVCHAADAALRAERNMREGCREWGMAFAELARTWTGVAEAMYAADLSFTMSGGRGGQAEPEKEGAK